jgi:hypothetical protein
MAQILFSEVQHFRGNPLWTILLSLPVLIFVSVLSYQLFTGEPVGTNPMSNLSLTILSLLVLIPASWAWLRVKLTTIIDEEKIAYGWNMPTAELNEIRLQDIKEWSVISYSFVGYGFRLSRKYGSIHNLSGSKGLQIITRSGERILIGTHQAEKLKDVLQKAGIGSLGE